MVIHKPQRKAMEALAAYCQTSVEDIAEQIMAKSLCQNRTSDFGTGRKISIGKEQNLLGWGRRWSKASLITYF